MQERGADATTARDLLETFKGDAHPPHAAARSDGDQQPAHHVERLPTDRAFRNLSGSGMLFAGLLSCLDTRVITPSRIRGCKSASSASAVSLSETTSPATWMANAPRCFRALSGSSIVSFVHS